VRLRWRRAARRERWGNCSTRNPRQRIPFHAARIHNRSVSFDCTKCPGYCCSHERIEVTDHDIERLAKHFGIGVRTARRRFTYRYVTKDHDERILRHHKDTVYKSVCRFFDRDLRRCTVYAARPNVCRKYPYGNTCGYYGFLRFERTFHDDPEFVPAA
jgi:Fe-S-cluster containining protein